MIYLLSISRTDKPIARPVLVQQSTCRFPEWARGRWALARIEADLFKFKDQEKQFRTLNSKCVQRFPVSTVQPSERFLVHTLTQW